MVEIIYEDKNYIVVEKPVGVASQTERGSAMDMVSILMNYFYKNGNKNPYVGVVHRLDKTVGGVMVYGKTKEATSKLSSAVSSRDVIKKYYAVINNPETLDKSGHLEDMLYRDGRTNMSRVISSDELNMPDSKLDKKMVKKAVLDYELIKTVEIDDRKYGLLDISLKTGRHHQIRVQLANRGHDLYGDRKYGAVENESIKSKDRGIGLYCYHMEFKSPTTGKVVSYELKPNGGIFDKLSF